ncbi:MAG: ankyrin repeat domain-containing protein [Lysobacterales bacterium]
MNSSRVLRIILPIGVLGMMVGLACGCSMLRPSIASFELHRMKPDRYFADAVQANFAEAVGKGDLVTADRLLARGATVNAEGNEGMTPLFWAMAKQNRTGFEFLLAHDADPNVVTRWSDVAGEDQSASAMDMPAIMEDGAYLHALLEHGGDPNQVYDSTRQTPIYAAILNQRRANVEMLLEAGADINHQDLSRKTPIHYSVNTTHFAMALRLLELGADARLKNRWGFSAVDSLKKFEDRGVRIGSADDKAYPQLIAELKTRGLWDTAPMR